jgi:hypothetical protein
MLTSPLTHHYHVRPYTGPELFDKEQLPQFAKDYDAEKIDIDALVELL